MGDYNLTKYKNGDFWRAVLPGGAIAMLLTVGQYVATDSGDFSLTLVLVGGIIAGYLAERNDFDSSSAGAVAGVIGALPGLILFSPRFYRFFAEWISADAFVSTLIAIPAVLLVILSGAALLGFLGGYLGSWLAAKIGTGGNSPFTT